MAFGALAWIFECFSIWREEREREREREREGSWRAELRDSFYSRRKILISSVAGLATRYDSAVGTRGALRWVVYFLKKRFGFERFVEL